MKNYENFFNFIKANVVDLQLSDDLKESTYHCESPKDNDELTFEKLNENLAHHINQVKIGRAHV